MTTLIKMLHVLSLGLWAGAVVFFSFFVALPSIAAMRQFAQTPGNWLGLSTETQGTRLAGEFLDVVFSRYFPFQLVCGIVALLTACCWLKHSGVVHKLRVVLITVAVALVSLNLWYFAPQVHELRQQRYSADTRVADSANAAFNSAHTYSLVADIVGLLCVLGALVLVVWLPGRTHKES